MRPPFRIGASVTLRRSGTTPVPTASFREFVGPPKLLGPDFAGDSWTACKTVIAGAPGEKFSGSERQHFCELPGSDPPPRELWLAIGRARRQGHHPWQARRLSRVTLPNTCVAASGSTIACVEATRGGIVF